MTATRLRVRALTATAALMVPAIASAQQDTVALRKVVQFAIPKAPAFDFIGISPDEVSRPTSPRALATAIASGINTAGQVQQGLAIEVAPVQLLRPRMDLSAYQRRGGFVLSNLSISLGSAQASGDSSVMQLAVGAKAVLLDRTDPLGPNSKASGDSAIQRALVRCLPAGPVDVADTARVAQVRRCITAEDSVFRADWRRDHWNDYAMALAAATGWGLRNSEWKDGQHLGSAVWALAAAPLCLRPAAAGLCRSGQWLAKAAYERRDSVQIGRTVSQFTGGLRGALGSETVAAFAEALFRRRSTELPGAQRSRREWSAGVEFKVTDGLWASTGVGGRYNDLTQGTKAVLLAGLRFNVSPDQRLTLAPTASGR